MCEIAECFKNLVELPSVECFPRGVDSEVFPVSASPVEVRSEVNLPFVCRLLPVTGLTFVLRILVFPLPQESRPP